MNIPPNVIGPSLPFKVESGDPVIVHVTFKGQKYAIRLSQVVMGVWSAPGVDQFGNPQFSVQAAPAMTVIKETDS